MAHEQKPDFVFRWNGEVHLTFKNLASYIQDGRTATHQMLHFIYFFKQM